MTMTMQMVTCGGRGKDAQFRKFIYRSRVIVRRKSAKIDFVFF